MGKAKVESERPNWIDVNADLLWWTTIDTGESGELVGMTEVVLAEYPDE